MNAMKEKHNLITSIQREIKQKKYTSALNSLKALASVGGDRQLILWQSALLESKTGNLYAALHYVNEIDGDFLPKATRLQAAIVQNKSSFDTLINSYNEILSTLNSGNYEMALKDLDKAIALAGDLPLPIFIIKTRLLILAKLQHTSITRYVIDVPVYAAEDETIQKVISFIQKNEEVKSLPMKKNGRNKLFIFPYVTAVAAVTLSIYIYFDNKPTPHAEVEVFTPYKTIPEKSLIIGEVEENIVSVAEPVEDVTPLFIPQQIAKSYYVTGYDKYKIGQHEEAISYLKMVLSSEEVVYFTDDAAYYLTVSYLKEEKYDEVLKMAAQFAANESIHYKESPYHEAIRLQEGIATFKLGQIDDAKDLLTELTGEQVVSWVRNEARIKLKTVIDSE